jgi:hypothetical protein
MAADGLPYLIIQLLRDLVNSPHGRDVMQTGRYRAVGACSGSLSSFWRGEGANVSPLSLLRFQHLALLFYGWFTLPDSMLAHGP